MATVKCALGKRGRPSHEWNDGKKDRIYCLGRVVFFVILFSLFCVLVATLLVWAILIIVKDVIELWRKIKE